MPLTIDPSDVDAVLFDMGGIFFLPLPRRVRAALVRCGLEAPADDASFHRAHFLAIHAYDHSDDLPETWDAYLATYLTALGVLPEQLDDIARRVEPIWNEPASEHWSWAQADEVEAFRIVAGGARAVAVVSNCDGSAAESLRNGRVCQVGPGPGVEVAIVVDSHLVGVRKPDPAIFTPAVEAVGATPDRVIYVGDTVKNDVAGARAAGLHPVHLDPYDLYAGARHDRIRTLRELAEHLH